MKRFLQIRWPSDTNVHVKNGIVYLGTQVSASGFVPRQYVPFCSHPNVPPHFSEQTE